MEISTVVLSSPLAIADPSHESYDLVATDQSSQTGREVTT